MAAENKCIKLVRSGDSTDSESECEDPQQKSSPSHSFSTKEAGNQSCETSNFYDRESNVTHEDKTVKVKEIEESVIDTTKDKEKKGKQAPSEMGSAKAVENGGMNRSANETEKDQGDVITGENKFDPKKDGEKVDSKSVPTPEQERNVKKDIGKGLHPMQETKQNETSTVEEVDPVDEFVQRLPECDRQANNAYQSCPVSPCERHFTPADRLPGHESVREEILPADSKNLKKMSMVEKLEELKDLPRQSLIIEKLNNEEENFKSQATSSLKKYMIERKHSNKIDLLQYITDENLKKYILSRPPQDPISGYTRGDIKMAEYRYFWHNRVLAKNQSKENSNDLQMDMPKKECDSETNDQTDGKIKDKVQCITDCTIRKPLLSLAPRTLGSGDTQAKINQAKPRSTFESFEEESFSQYKKQSNNLEVDKDTDDSESNPKTDGEKNDLILLGDSQRNNRSSQSMKLSNNLEVDIMPKKEDHSESNTQTDGKKHYLLQHDIDEGQINTRSSQSMKLSNNLEMDNMLKKEGDSEPNTQTDGKKNYLLQHDIDGNQINKISSQTIKHSNNNLEVDNMPKKKVNSQQRSHSSSNLAQLEVESEKVILKVDKFRKQADAFTNSRCETKSISARRPTTRPSPTFFYGGKGAGISKSKKKVQPTDCVSDISVEKNGCFRKFRKERRHKRAKSEQRENQKCNLM